MEFSRLTIFTGNYGSGKTEISLNTAIWHAGQGRKTLLADMDVVNPYFRSSEKADLLQAKGIRVLQPVFAGSGLDIPALAPEVLAAFSRDDTFTVFDAGGDPVGAMALGRYREYFERAGYEMYLVVNPMRPLSATAEDIEQMLRLIERNARLKAKALINNTNVARETTLEDMRRGAETVREASRRCGIPIAYTCGSRERLDAFRAAMLPEDGEAYPIEIMMRPEWMDF